jgi:hypothetical protein
MNSNSLPTLTSPLNLSPNLLPSPLELLPSLPKLPLTLHPKQALALIMIGMIRTITCLRRRRLINFHLTILKTLPGAA